MSIGTDVSQSQDTLEISPERQLLPSHIGGTKELHSRVTCDHIYTVGAQLGCKLVNTVDVVTSWSQVGL